MICLCSGTPSVTRAKTIVVSGSINLLEEGSSTYHDLDISRKEGWVQWPLNRWWCSKASEKKEFKCKEHIFVPRHSSALSRFPIIISDIERMETQKQYSREREEGNKVFE